MSEFSMLFGALAYAARRHSGQRRKDAEKTPYINHPLQVASALAVEAGVTDLVTLMAAVLHDTVEDTGATLDELEALFGPEVAVVVGEVTDDKSLPKEKRKQLQIEHAPHLSKRAKRLKIADKLCNVRDVSLHQPADWPRERRAGYLDWTEKVVAGCRGVDEALEGLYDRELAEARKRLAEEGGPECAGNPERA